MENTTTREDLACEHGLSLYIEANGKRILFDTGASAAFADNAEKLGIDLNQVDLCILSHGHYDHGGGIKRFLEVNDHAPELSPPWGSLCSTPDRGSGLLLGATDEDLPPHGAPFHFQLSPRVPELARNWSLSQVNGEPPTHTPGVQSLGEVPAGAPSGPAGIGYQTQRTDGETEA